MASRFAPGDRLFLIAENLAQDSSLFPEEERDLDPPLRGILSDADIARRNDYLDNVDIDSYIEAVVSAAEDPKRTAAPKAIAELGEVVSETSEAAFYAAIVNMDFGDEVRPVGFIAQDRGVRSGEWMPQHHLLAARKIEEYSNRSIPIVSLMDTPGAAADADANRGNQAHSISLLIAEMSNTDVPNLGIVFGLGYSGGAIPLAASNMILSVRDGVFSTIQPRSLASIARRLNLSWQQCAKEVGLSPFELKRQGNIDAIIDYAPGEDVTNLHRAIVSGIRHVEESTRRFVADNPYIIEHYARSLERYLNPSPRLQATQASAALTLTRNPTEYVNVFGVAYRYLRYLRVRRRIRSTTVHAYGRLAEHELPAGELARRAARERRETFLSWLQDPDKVIYDDALAKPWRNYVEKKAAIHDEPGRFRRLLLGEPRKNFQDARAGLIANAGMYLYNRWKVDAAGNFASLRGFIANHEDAAHLFGADDIPAPRRLVAAIRADAALGPALHERFSYEAMQLITGDLGGTPDASLREQLSSALNLAMTEGSLTGFVDQSALPPHLMRAANGGGSPVVINRLLLDSHFTGLVRPRTAASPSAIDSPDASVADVSVLDILLNEELRADFASECENLLLFDRVYDAILANLDSIAKEAGSTHSLSRESVQKLIDAALKVAVKDEGFRDSNASVDEMRQRLFDWYQRVSAQPRASAFFRAVEEWKQTAFPHVSDALFVVVTFLFERLLGSYLRARLEGRRYEGRISPRSIGRRKDFWNRLSNAYRDLLIQNVLTSYKRRRDTGHDRFIAEFFDDFNELYGDLLSSDPCEFPGFRSSIEGALNAGQPPCGVVTGIGTFKNGAGGLPCGVVISNVGFQAGSFDMASAEKFCKLLVRCAQEQLPLICFISSGGMQTKEGAGALFSMAAINDRLTRFVRDYDLPAIIFGYGDCTGGAQASFVTHPLVQTYYLSGASMPFAGQIVVTSYLPAESHLANYLASEPGAMQGLVKHPFHTDLDDELRRIDPDIPVPEESVVDVVNRVVAGVLEQERPAGPPVRASVPERELLRPVRRMLIHARGCTAVKLVRVAQRKGVGVVLVQSDPDMESVPVDMLGDNDTVVCIGGNTPDESYLNALSVIAVAEQQEVDSLHPGIGFLSESSQFAELVRSRAINFVGPPVNSMNTMGNKSNAIAAAMRLGVPVVPGSHGIVTDPDRAAATAASIGYPVLVKAVHGGGGKGIQVVESADRFHELFHRVSVEARAAFGNGDVYLERYITRLRHIEVQLLRDADGNTRVLGLRDCSVQRDRQKVIEESGSTSLPDELAEEVMRHSASLADEVGYIGAGTVEFIHDLDGGAAYFMEMNTRLQVEHPVTERVSGVDIVGEQLRIAAGESIADLAMGAEGYAIEARINAERIVRSASGELSFQPSPGQIVTCEWPEADDIDVISIAAEGKFVSPYYDSMVAQIICHGPDRATTAARLADWLAEVRITGISTNIALLVRVLRDEVFLGGDYDTGFLPAFLQRIDADALIEEIAEAAGDSGQAIGREAVAIEGSTELRVLAPSTGIFYLTPSPADPPYVRVGETVPATQILCQLEAFKIFTPLHLADFNAPDSEPLYDPEASFEVTRINVSSGQQVNAGDLLFVVKPVAS